MLPPCRASLLLQEDDAYCAGDGYANPAKVKVPTSLPAALDAFEADEVLKAALGEQFSTWYDIHDTKGRHPPAVIFPVICQDRLGTNVT
jgi:hypothetical protein